MTPRPHGRGGDRSDDRGGRSAELTSRFQPVTEVLVNSRTAGSSSLRDNCASSALPRCGITRVLPDGIAEAGAPSRSRRIRAAACRPAPDRRRGRGRLAGGRDRPVEHRLLGLTALVGRGRGPFRRPKAHAMPRRGDSPARPLDGDLSVPGGSGRAPSCTPRYTVPGLVDSLPPHDLQRPHPEHCLGPAPSRHGR